MLADKEVLTPEQQKALFEMIRERCGPAGNGARIGGHRGLGLMFGPPRKEPFQVRGG